MVAVEYQTSSLLMFLIIMLSCCRLLIVLKRLRLLDLGLMQRLLKARELLAYYLLQGAI
jgi:hypothetical protein